MDRWIDGLTDRWVDGKQVDELVIDGNRDLKVKFPESKRLMKRWKERRKTKRVGSSFR